MLNICIPMAGRGLRFVEAGYNIPKPFIPLKDGTPMIQRVVENLTPYEPYRFIFLARRSHESYIRKHMSFATTVIYVDEVTEGAACTVLLAKELINNGDGLIIANSDQLVEWNNSSRVMTSDEDPRPYWKESNNIQDMINTCDGEGSIAIFHATHPKWSYAKLGEDGYVSEVAEKKVISNNATVGVYYFKEGCTFVSAAEDMIKKDIRVNGEFYVCPVFNEIAKYYAINTYPILKMMGMGTPEDLDKTVEYLSAQV